MNKYKNNYKLHEFNWFLKFVTILEWPPFSTSYWSDPWVELFSGGSKWGCDAITLPPSGSHFVCSAQFWFSCWLSGYIQGFSWNLSWIMAGGGSKRKRDTGEDDPAGKKPKGMQTRSSSKTPPANRSSGRTSGGRGAPAPPAVNTVPTIPINWMDNLPEDHGM